MTTKPLYVELSAGSRTVRLNGTGGFSSDYLIVNENGVEGWYSTPDAKATQTEMQTGDGAHAVAETDILYAARTVTLNWTAAGDTRSKVHAGIEDLLSLAHKLVTIRVVDANSDTYATGYLQVETDNGIARNVATGTVTIVCADPRRYATSGHATQIYPSDGTRGGLCYMQEDGWQPKPLYPSDTTWPGDNYPGILWTGVLAYPLYYTGTTAPAQNSVVITNSGTSPIYPTITITGVLEGGFTLSWSGGSISYSETVRGIPLVLDSLTRTASLGGVDSSRYLTERTFPVIQPGETETIKLTGNGSGWATVEWCDTYI